MTRPFRFGVQLTSLPAEGWADRVRRIESLGYSTLFCPDHFGSQWDPTTLLAAAAAVSNRLRLGSLVYDVDYRHPVVYAKQAATLQLLSGGRHEFGIGAGWMKSDYDEAGIAYERPGVRIERLEEALRIVRAMWSHEKTSFGGKHYTVREIARAVDPAPATPPRILIGGGGPRLLRLAGRHADIVGINPTLVEGRVTNQTAADLAPERMAEKVRSVREGAEAAGRRFEDLELNSLTFVSAVVDDPRELRRGLAAHTGMSEEQIADCPLFLTGSAREIQDRLQRRRESLGISYVVIQGRDLAQLEQFAGAVVAPLAGR